jgi:hypothetical protein
MKGDRGAGLTASGCGEAVRGEQPRLAGLSAIGRSRHSEAHVPRGSKLRSRRFDQLKANPAASALGGVKGAATSSTRARDALQLGSGDCRQTPSISSLAMSATIIALSALTSWRFLDMRAFSIVGAPQ